jgi:peptide subunit release factor 1 (eRF1)
LKALDELLEDDDRFGFIVMDGNGSLYGTLQVLIWRPWNECLFDHRFA